jgi:RNA recognition motif-containing protein
MAMERKSDAIRAVEKTDGEDFYGRRLHVELSKKPFMDSR